MSLRHRVLWLVAMTSLLLVVAGSVVAWQIVLPEFERLESDGVQTHESRLRSVLKRDEETLKTKLLDYSQ